jgi:hypothetical protein
MTLTGIARDQDFEIFSHPHRVLQPRSMGHAVSRRLQRVPELVMLLRDHEVLAQHLI